MNFSFDVNEIFRHNLSRVDKSLLPKDFLGNHQTSVIFTTRISEILDKMGQASAKAQSLRNAITTAERLRNFDHTVYFLTDPSDNSGKGSVVGLLKVGRKKLFIFDSRGFHHEIEPLCVLDFYVHESKQRKGLGNKLFRYMLQEENIKPEHLAIDRPSQKFLSFLRKHYDLEKIIPQPNHFVIFESFFGHNPGISNTGMEQKQVYGCIPRCREGTAPSSSILSKEQKRTGSKFTITEPSQFDRYIAPKPASTIGLLLQDPQSWLNKTAVQTHRILKEAFGDHALSQEHFSSISISKDVKDDD